MRKWCRTFLLSLLLCSAMCAGAQAAEHDMLRVGLKYGNEAMDEARLQNYSPFGGYALGYYDGSCNLPPSQIGTPEMRNLRIRSSASCNV